MHDRPRAAAFAPANATLFFVVLVVAIVELASNALLHGELREVVGTA
jgi:hypothetical protein